MNSFSNVSAFADPLEAARAAAQLLVPGTIQSVEAITGGRNSRVFRVQSDAKTFALKQYPRPVDGSRDRMGAEVAALEFLGRHRVLNLPRVVATDPSYGYAVFTWIQGDPVTDPTEADVDATLRLVSELVVLGRADGADKIGNASAATFTGGEVVQQVECRMVKFRGATQDEPELKQFLEDEFTSVFRDVSAWAWNGYAHETVGFEDVRPAGSRTLSPSDFGFHNTLRQSNGALAFIDFEYFGWDDSVKMVSDFLLHPGMNLDQALKTRFLDGAVEIFGGGDGSFEARLKALYPLYGLCWCLIRLNEFSPEHAHRQELWGGSTRWEDAKSHQLELAKAALKNVKETYEHGTIVG